MTDFYVIPISKRSSKKVPVVAEYKDLKDFARLRKKIPKHHEKMAGSAPQAQGIKENKKSCQEKKLFKKHLGNWKYWPTYMSVKSQIGVCRSLVARPRTSPTCRRPRWFDRYSSGEWRKETFTSTGNLGTKLEMPPVG